MNGKMETIHIYHTNDLHSHFDNWPQMNRFFQTAKKEHAEREEACFIFDIGDHVDRFHPFTEGTVGKGNVALMNQSRYDAVTIGNNEGITLSKKALNSLYEGAAFDVLVCNLYEMDGTLPKWVQLFQIYETPQKTKIGVFGVTAEYPDFYSKLGWKIQDAREAIQQVLMQLKEKVDVLICLSHLGVHEDRQLADQFPEIDVILGGHTHHLFLQGEERGETILAATGKHGEYIGHVTLEMNKSQIVRKNAEVIPTNSLERFVEDTSEVNTFMSRGKKTLQEKVFYNPEDLPQELFGSGPLATFFGQAMIAYTEADCALFNAGIFLSGLPKGWVTKEHLHALLPHPINPCLVTLDGADLLEVYELSMNEDWPRLEIKGLGFRGTVMGAMVREQLERDERGQLIAGGRLVRSGEIYTLATLDMFTFGFFFPSLKEARKEYFMPELIRDVVGWYGKVKWMN